MPAKESRTHSTARGITAVVLIDVPDDAAFDIDARTRSGAVRSDHPVAVREMRSGRLQGAVRGGGLEVTLRTGSGSIAIN